MRQDYFTQTHHQRIQQATSYQELTDVALDIIHNIPQPIHQVCGPISSGGLGSIEKNLKEFDRAIQYFSKHVNVFDQMPFEDPMQELKHTETSDLMEVFYRPIFASNRLDTLLFLPGWKSSTGAKIERKWADEYNIQAIELPTDWDTHTNYLSNN